ncbi:MAG: LysR family transcriptional regulator [Thalassotalea sp.]|nr:LysR family transcriptional regulator [Thalassotalea sp.]
MNWNDIRIFLEVARTETLTVAAKRLTMDPSTVSRRLHHLEESLSAQLFERSANGHTLTQDGERLLISARRMEQDAKTAYEQIAHHNLGSSGKVRIGVTEAFGNFFIAPHLNELKHAYPDITIDLLPFARDVKISRNEADIAIAIERPKSTSMIVTKLTDYKLQLYVSKSLLPRLTLESIDDLPNQPWVTYVEDLIFSEQLSYLNEISKDIEPQFRSTSVVGQYTAIKSGLGLGILPCFMGENDENLVKLFPEEISIQRSFWLITHPELKRLKRVANVWEYLKSLVKKHQALLMPEG